MLKYIGFYGQSYCAYSGADSYISMLQKYFNCDIVNIGVRQGSEERVLIELKKTKKLDYAVIFHSEPSYIYLPECDRDFDIKGLLDRHAENIWKAFEIDKIVSNWSFHKEHHEKFFEKFNSSENFVNVVKHYKEYFYDQNLFMNRYYGSLIQIDQYLESLSINSVHIMTGKVTLPTWYNFKNIIPNNEILEIFESHKHNETPNYVNGITPLGNQKVFEYLINIMAARSRNGATTSDQLVKGGSNPPAAPKIHD